MQINDFNNKPAAGVATTMPSASQSIFDEYTHKPPRIDQFGYNKETHKGRELLNRNAKNILNETNRIPTWWQAKNIHFGTVDVDLPIEAHTQKHKSVSVTSEKGLIPVK